MDNRLAEEQAEELGNVKTAFVLAVITLVIVTVMFVAPIFA